MSKFILGMFCVFFLAAGAASVAEAGSKIAFTSFRDGNYEIYVMDADGSNQTNITNNPFYDYFPAWSPNGNQIAFYSDRVGPIGPQLKPGIYLMDADGSNQTRLANEFFFPDTAPAWSPNGNQIAFISTIDGNYEIYVMDADGSNQTRLTNDSSVDAFPAWSPELPEPVPTTSPMGQIFAVLILGGATALYLNRRRQPGSA